MTMRLLKGKRSLPVALARCRLARPRPPATGLDCSLGKLGLSLLLCAFRGCSVATVSLPPMTNREEQ